MYGGVLCTFTRGLVSTNSNPLGMEVLLTHEHPQPPIISNIAVHEFQLFLVPLVSLPCAYPLLAPVCVSVAAQCDQLLWPTNVGWPQNQPYQLAANGTSMRSNAAEQLESVWSPFHQQPSAQTSSCCLAGYRLVVAGIEPAKPGLNTEEPPSLLR